MRKGQGAMEYLMTYGWALLVIIIVGAALFALGVLNPSTYQNKLCTGFQYFTYLDHKATHGPLLVGDDQLIIVLRNGVSDVTNIDSLKVTVGANSETAITGGAAPTLTVSETGTIGQGQQITLTATLDDIIPSADYNNVNVEIQYDTTAILDNVDDCDCTGSPA